MIELIGIFLLAGTVTSVAVINAIHRPFEIRSEDPHDFDITALEAYNRLLEALSTRKIKNHHLQLKETVDPLYFIAVLNYADEIGNACEALVTFDVVEGYKSTTTIRWTCKFLKWCEKPTALAVRNLLDQWIVDCLGSLVASQPDEAQTASPLPAIIEQSKDKPKTSAAEKAGAVSEKFKQKVRKPPPAISPSPQQYPIALKEAYKRVNQALQEASAASVLRVKEQIEEAYIVIQLYFGEDKLKPGGEGSAVLNIDFSEPSWELTTITWSCEFKHWYAESGVQDIQQFIESWLAKALSNEASGPTSNSASGIAAATPAAATATATAADTDIADGSDGSGSANQEQQIALETPPPPPVARMVRSNYPKEFAYLKLMQRISSAPQKNTKWKLIECNQGNRIVARMQYTSPHKPEAICNVHSTLDFEGDASTGMVQCIFVVSPDSDAQIALNFVEDTQKWIELSLR